MTTPTRAGLGLTASAVLALTLLPGSAGAAAPAAPPLDYTITVEEGATGPAIDDTMYGVFYEDINNAADGGLHAELVRNRSFEFNGADRAGWTGTTGWELVDGGGAAPPALVVDDDTRLNERNRNHFRLVADGAGDGVRNTGSGSGVALKAGATYDFSVWARTSTAQTMTVALQGPGGRALGTAAVAVDGSDEWKQYRATLTASGTTAAGRLVLTAGAASVVGLDMVSLLPTDRWVGKNGVSPLRKDLAQKIADLEPGFVRFPGGCIVNVGSMYSYDAENGYPRARSYQWKDTVGPVEERPTNANFWGYNQSYGIGYYEYFTFAEDIGAMPLPVVPALVTGCGQNRATDDPELLQRHIQDTLDLVEFANGGVDTEWGGLRAEMGHPEPFGLTHIGVGNEENLPQEFGRNFLQFEAAIKAKYPDMVVISNSGPDDEGATFDAHWDFNRANDVDMVDEHYYNSPAWFLQNNDRYDSYDREGPEVFLGEYASLDNRWQNSLAEAAYMTGLERNADVVKLASYAPLLADVDSAQWRPDMIWFDGQRSWGSTSYEVQKLFMTNVGDEVVPSAATGAVVEPEPITGGVGLSTWATTAAYDDVRVTTPGGGTLLADDFSDGDAAGWERLAGGTWSVEDGRYVQSDVRAENTLVRSGDITATDYDISLTATKTAGAEGFLVGFGVQGSGDYYWWNIGGWGNTRSVVEKATGGAKQIVHEGPHQRVEDGRTYDVEVQVRGTTVTLLLDGQEWGSFTDDAVSEPFAHVVTEDAATGDLLVKVVNAQDRAARTTLDLGDDRRLARRAQMTVLQGDPRQQNTRSAQPIKPVTTTVSRISSTFTRTFPANSVTVLRIPTR